MVYDQMLRTIKQKETSVMAMKMDTFSFYILKLDISTL